MDKLIAITDRKEIALLLAGAGELDVPHLFGGDGHPYFTKADELRVWRASQFDTEVNGLQTDFEKFALDHKAHRHCQACGGCLLDPAWYVQQFAAWCVGCRERIKKALPVGAEPPWQGGWEL